MFSGSTLKVGLMVMAVLLSMVSDLLPGCAPEPPVRSRLLVLFPSARVTATVKGRPIALRPSGPGLAAAGLPAWNWGGPRPLTAAMPKTGSWEFPESVKPGRVEEACLWVHPVNDGSLRLDFPDVPLGGHLQGFFFAPTTAAKRVKIKADVLVDDRRVERLKPALKAGGVWEFDVALPGAGEGTLSVVIHQLARGKNHLCFDGVIHGP